MTSNKKSRGLFITGTDTGVGKTYVTQQILQQLASQSISCVAMKPVASGAIQTPMGLRNEDALILQRASSVDVPYELVNPYCFEPAIAPHLAAQHVGTVIESTIIMEAFQELSLIAEVVLVEGVGGWQVPLNTNTPNYLSVSLLAEKMQLPIVLVVGLGLGCINHALLSHYSIYNGPCTLVGWVANRVERDFISADECVATLSAQISEPLLANLPWLGDQSSVDINSNFNVVIDLDHCLKNS